MPARKGKQKVLPPATPAVTRSKAAQGEKSPNQDGDVQDRLTRIELAIERMAAMNQPQPMIPEPPAPRGRVAKKDKAKDKDVRRSISLDTGMKNVTGENFHSSIENNDIIPGRQQPLASSSDVQPPRDQPQRPPSRHDPVPAAAARPTNPPWNVDSRPRAATSHDMTVNNPWTSWLSEARPANPTPAPLPSAPYDLQEPSALFDSNDVEAQVQQILATTAHSLSKGNCKPRAYPFQYVARGPERRKITINNASLPEHLWGIIRMVKDEKTDPILIPYLLKHLEDVIEDACDFEWQRVRRWSEEIFSLVAEKRLEHGWAETNRIQMLRMNMSKVETVQFPPNRNPPANRNQQFAQPQDQVKGGPPCPAYNAPSGCSLASGHLTNGRRMQHICTFCLYNSSAPYTHPETQCRNKLRYPPPHF